MKQFGGLIVVGLAAVAVASAVHAGGAYGRITFVGSIVTDACSTGLPPLGVQGGIGRCGASPSSRAMYVEQMSVATANSGVAVLDYFVDRPGGGRKMIATRQYR